MASRPSRVPHPQAVCINNNVSVLGSTQGYIQQAIIPNNTHPRTVFVTPLTSTLTPVMSRPPTTSTTVSVVKKPQSPIKVLLKAVSKVGKNNKMFTLRIVNANMASCDSLKSVIKSQLQKDIISGEFDFGYMKSSNMISIRTQPDLAEIWSEIRSGKSITMWCDGLRDASKKRTYSMDQDENAIFEETQPPKKKRSADDRDMSAKKTLSV